MTVGTTDITEKTTRMLLEEGQVVFVEKYSYPSTMETFKSIEAKVVAVEMDEQGIIPAELEKECLRVKEKGWIAKVVYLIPTGQNPTGITASLQRKKEVYQVAQKYGLIIIEDDSYYYLVISRSNSSGKKWGTDWLFSNCQMTRRFSQ